MVRDAVLSVFDARQGVLSVSEIAEEVGLRLGETSDSSIRSSLNLHVPEVFERVGRGHYKLASDRPVNCEEVSTAPEIVEGKTALFQADCFDWLAQRERNSLHAVVTDPPYGVHEYTTKEQAKLRAGRGGVWRIPPSFDGHRRSPLPRFTVMNDGDREALYRFFKRFGSLLRPAVVPGANVIIASNPLFSHLVASSMVEAGFEMRGYVARLTMTMRGGDRPKNAHEEFSGVSVMPRSMWEPWVVLRKPLEGRVQDNLRKWGTGGLRRPSAGRPFGDVIPSNPTSARERAIAPHPSLKPQSFLRRIVHASLPLGEGVVFDPFAGSGSTLAAANAVGYESVGVEKDKAYVSVARRAIPALARLEFVDPIGAELF